MFSEEISYLKSQKLARMPPYRLRANRTSPPLGSRLMVSGSWSDVSGGTVALVFGASFVRVMLDAA